MITLKTLPKASAQEVFDQVAVHLLTQNKKAMNGSEDTCAYRGIENTCCAAGCLIADNEYKKSFEDKRWDALVERGEVPSMHAQLIDRLQSLHDGGLVEHWKNLLIGLADRNELNTNHKIFEEVK